MEDRARGRRRRPWRGWWLHLVYGLGLWAIGSATLGAADQLCQQPTGYCWPLGVGIVDAGLLSLVYGVSLLWAWGDSEH